MSTVSEDYLRLILGELRDLNSNITNLGLALKKPAVGTFTEDQIKRREAAVANFRAGRPPEQLVASAPKPAASWGLDVNEEVELRRGE
jgi:hypothetical protein